METRLAANRLTTLDRVIVTTWTALFIYMALGALFF